KNRSKNSTEVFNKIKRVLRLYLLWCPPLLLLLEHGNPILPLRESGWMNEMPVYDPETYHPSLTHSVYATLEGSRLRLAYPHTNIPRQAAFDEPPHEVVFLRSRCYQLANCKVSLLPAALARKRVWNKKYPICIILAEGEGQEEEEEEERTDKQTLPDTQTQGLPDTLYLFGRTGREKEDWFQHFLLASKSEFKSSPIRDVPKSGKKPCCPLLIWLVTSKWHPIPCGSWLCVLADSDEESSSAGSSDEEEVPPTEPQGTLGDKITGTPPPPATDGVFIELRFMTPLSGSGGSTGRRFVDKIASSKYFQKATENEYIKKKIAEVSNMPLMLTVEVLELSGTLAVNIPPPPTDRIWYSFRVPPRLDLRVRPMLGEREVTFTHVTEWIEKKLSREFQVSLSSTCEVVPEHDIHCLLFLRPLQKEFVMPNMDDLYLPLMSSTSLSLPLPPGLWLELEVVYTGCLQMTLETKLNLCKLGKEKSIGVDADGHIPETSQVGSKPRLCVLADSDEESSSADSSDEEEVPPTEPQGTLGDKSTGTPPPPATDGGSGGSTGRRFLRFVDKIASSKYFQKATENEYIKKKIAEVSNMPLMLTVEVLELSGTLAVNIPPPPTDRIWYSFRVPPRLDLRVRPMLGEREVTFTHVTEWIEKKLSREFQKEFVMPNMDDLYLPLMSSVLDNPPAAQHSPAHSSRRSSNDSQYYVSE
ncbi:unnamed protein product, partial [Oncorhynchus mykiss]